MCRRVCWVLRTFFLCRGIYYRQSHHIQSRQGHFWTLQEQQMCIGTMQDRERQRTGYKVTPSPGVLTLPCISRCLSKASQPIFLKYWSQYFSFFMIFNSGFIILLVIQISLNFFLIHSPFFRLLHTQRIGLFFL